MSHRWACKNLHRGQANPKHCGAHPVKTRRGSRMPPPPSTRATRRWGDRKPLQAVAAKRNRGHPPWPPTDSPTEVEEGGPQLSKSPWGTQLSKRPNNAQPGAYCWSLTAGCPVTVNVLPGSVPTISQLSIRLAFSDLNSRSHSVSRRLEALMVAS